MTIHNSLSELIGNTPLVKLNHVTDGIKATIAVKVEYLNPGGSSKDRIAERIIEVVVTPTDAGPDDPRSYYQVADRLAKAIPGGYRPNQYDNPNGPESHYHTTGPEIWEATDHKVTHFVAGIGTGGTISGTGHYLKDVSNGAVQVIGADPEGSIYSDPNDVHQYQIEGVGEREVGDHHARCAEGGELLVHDVERLAGLGIDGEIGGQVVFHLHPAAGEDGEDQPDDDDKKDKVAFIDDEAGELEHKALAALFRWLCHRRTSCIVICPAHRAPRRKNQHLLYSTDNAKMKYGKREKSVNKRESGCA